jgi:hypothetical protein
MNVDIESLYRNGWSSFTFAPQSEIELKRQLLIFSRTMGKAVSARAGDSICSILSPTTANNANEKSLSKLHSVGEFPLHNDLAHWPTPCRYVILACICSGKGNRATFLLDTKKLPLSARQKSILRSTAFRVENGRQSFFSTIISSSRSFIRFDPGCMKETSSDCIIAKNILSRERWPNHVRTFHWSSGSVLIIDNWRVLHGRDNSKLLDYNRKLLRICVQ